MMKYSPGAVRSHSFTFQDKLFLDANIWLYLFGPRKPGDRWVRIYTEVFERILNANSQIYVDVLVLSEFINAYARTEWRTVAPHIRSFKDFRGSPDFKPIAEDITVGVQQVVNHCSRVESCFTTLDMEVLLTDYETGNFDFNDQVITEICKNNGFTLITNDGDFKTQEISILTANPKLL